MCVCSRVGRVHTQKHESFNDLGHFPYSKDSKKKDDIGTFLSEKKIPLRNGSFSAMYTLHTHT